MKHVPIKDTLFQSKSYQQLNQEAEERSETCRQAKVPIIDFLRMADYNLVYEPSDDTFLMLDALEYEYCNDDIRNHNSIDNLNCALEIGSGTGVSIVFLGTLVRKTKDLSSVKLYATDINRDAVRITNMTAQVNGIGKEILECVNCDLASPLLESLRHTCDVIIFNPPYVPTPNAELDDDGIQASWAGGKDGREVIDRAIPQIAELLSPHGTAYIITVDDNKPDEMSRTMMEKYGILVTPFMRRRARNEFLTVLKCSFLT